MKPGSSSGQRLLWSSSFLGYTLAGMVSDALTRTSRTRISLSSLLPILLTMGLIPFVYATALLPRTGVSSAGSTGSQSSNPESAATRNVEFFKLATFVSDGHIGFNRFGPGQGSGAFLQVRLRAGQDSNLRPED
jgi:hypothetical protein